MQTAGKVAREPLAFNAPRHLKKLNPAAAEAEEQAAAAAAIASAPLLRVAIGGGGGSGVQGGAGAGGPASSSALVPGGTGGGGGGGGAAGQESSRGGVYSLLSPGMRQHAGMLVSMRGGGGGRAGVGRAIPCLAWPEEQRRLMGCACCSLPYSSLQRMHFVLRACVLRVGTDMR